MNQNALTEFLYPSPAAGFIPDESVPIQMALSDYSLIERLGIVKTGEDHFKNDTTDPARCACFYRTVSFWQFMEQNRFFEFHRQRYKGGETLHDYFFYFTFGEAEIP